jgi:zinc D-Ala-D-Ala carboxypeptidase
MKATAEAIFEPLRDIIGKPIHISSFYRTVELNKAMKGARLSQHLTGEAMDLDADTFGGTTNREIFDLIRKEFDFDQLIWEFGTADQPAWVHVSYGYERKNRREVLRATTSNGRTIYLPYPAE